MIKILLEMWPAFTPLGFYFCWVAYEKMRGKDVGSDEFTLKKRKYFYRAFVISIILAIGGLLYLGLSVPGMEHEENSSQVYSSQVHGKSQAVNP